VDANIIGVGEPGTSGHGVAPEDLLMGIQGVRGVVGAVQGATGAAGRTSAALANAASQAGPYAKFEVTRRVLGSAGIPEPYASIGATLVTGYTSRGKPIGGAQPSAAPPPPTGPAEGPVAFKDLPLQEQMAHLPTDTPAPILGRGPAPPLQSSAPATAADLASGRPMGAAAYVEKLKTLPPELRADVRAARPGAAAAQPPAETPLDLTRRVTQENRAAVTEPLPASAPPLGTTPRPAPTPPGPNNVQPPAVPQPPPPTTPANTPPRAAAPSPKAQAAAATISGWTPAEYDAVKDLPVNQRVAYLRMRQGGYAADEALATVEQMQKAERVQTQRAMQGAKKTAMELFGVSKDKVTDAQIARVKEMAPGPSRVPHNVITGAMDERFKEIALRDPRFQSLLYGSGLGDLATRGAP
jgi:hypothetical protein